MFSTFPQVEAPIDRGAQQADDHRNRMAAKSRAKSKLVAEIDHPPERNWVRWEQYQFDLHGFLSECFPMSTGLWPFSKDHRRMIECIQDSILHGGQDLNEVFRGGAKSSITEGSAIWAGGYGHRDFFVPIGATDEAAQQSLDSIQREFLTNEHLMEVFPAACHAARALEGVAQRAKKQTMGGAPTMIEWTTARCVLPTYEGFEGSGAIIWPRSITAKGLRGMRFKRPDGTLARPDFVMLDDSQTDETAASRRQTDKLEKTIRKTVLRLAGHNKQLACVANLTPIEPGDLVDRFKKDRLWRTNHIPILKSFSKAHETHWLGPYADLMMSASDDDKESRRKAFAKATEYYKANQRVMDAGAVPSWPHCFAEHEISAIQHAYNLLLELGEGAFMSECMLKPPREQTGLKKLTFEEFCAKQSEYGRGIVPPDATVLTCKVDVHPELLYWELWAFAPKFTGYCVDYGCFPEQPRRHFAHANPPRPLSSVFKGCDDDSRITQGLRALLHGGEDRVGLMHMAWTPKGAKPLKIVKCPVDANGQANEAVTSFINASPFRGVLYPEFGKGVLCRQAPMDQWPKARAQPHSGPGWFYTDTNPIGVMYDANAWKTRFHRGFSLPTGSQGALYLYKAKPTEHRMFVEHCLAEPSREVTRDKRIVHEFDEPKSGDDNHMFDVGVGCMVAASTAGITNLTPQAQRPRKRRKVTYYDA